MRRYGASVHAVRSPIHGVHHHLAARYGRARKAGANVSRARNIRSRGFFRSRILRGIIFSREIFFFNRKYTRNENETGKQRSKRKEYEITNERKGKRERERRERSGVLRKLTGHRVARLLNLFIVATNIITHRLCRRRFAARGAFHDLWWQGQEDKKKGHRSPSMRSREHTERTPDDDAGRSS